MLSAEEGWAFGSEGAVLHYTRAPGSAEPTWQRGPSLAVRDRSINGVAMVSPHEGWGIDGGWLFHYQDGEATYLSSPRAPFLLDILMLNSNEGWAVGIQGGILHYIGGEWQLVPSSTDKDLFSIDMLNAEEGWAVGNRVILHYQNGHWEEDESAPSAYYRYIDMVNEEEGWVVGDGVLLHYHDGVWEEMTDTPGVDSLHRIHMLSPEEGWGVGEDGLIMRYAEDWWRPEIGRAHV